MKEFSLPTHFQLEEKRIVIGELNRKFAATDYGQTLIANIRYGPLKPLEVSNDEWEKLLGADVNNFKHLNLTLGLTKSFLAGCANPHERWSGRVPHDAKFTSNEQATLLLTAAVHDWGEAIVGDIPFHDKKKTDEEREMIVLRRLVHEVVGEGNNSDACDKLASDVEKVITKADPKLGDAFSAIEKVGYMRTGFRAWVEHEKNEGIVKKSLEHLGFKVVTDHIPDLVHYASKYPPVDSFLRHHTGTITRIVSEGSERFSEKDSERFVTGKKVWRAHILR